MVPNKCPINSCLIYICLKRQLIFLKLNIWDFQFEQQALWVWNQSVDDKSKQRIPPAFLRWGSPYSTSPQNHMSSAQLASIVKVESES